MRSPRRRPTANRLRLDVATLEARRLLTTLVAIVDTGVDLTSATDAPYYRLGNAYDAYRQRLASQYGNSVVQDNGHTPDGSIGHWHGSTIADEVVKAIIDTKAATGASGADVKILPIRATNDSGYYDTGAVIRGIHYAADEGAAVIDLSFRASGDFASNDTGEWLSQAIAYANSKGTIVSVAAANDHVNVDDPSNPAAIYPLAIRSANMIVSAATDSSGVLSPISNWGSKRVDLGAPAYAGATSYAAGYTAGVTGVIAVLTPGMSATNRIKIIEASVTPTSQSVGAWSTTNGVINPKAAVARAIALTTPPTPVSPPPPVVTPPPVKTPTPTPTPTPTSTPPSILIAAGTATGAGSYVGDTTYVSGGNTYAVSNTIDTSAVSDPAPISVYQNERWTAGTLTYTVPKLAVGATYTVRLDFAENYFQSAGERSINVAVNGSPALTNFDIYAAAGASFKAISRSITTTADVSGKITISLTNVKGGAKVDAIRISPVISTTTTTAPTTTVSLASTYNAIGISSDSNPTAGNMDDGGNSYSGNLLGSTLTTGGVTYSLGAAGTKNAVKTLGQSVHLSAGQYSSLRFLGAGVNGTQSGIFTVTYTDGTTSQVRQTLSDWYKPTGAANESIAATTAYRNSTRGRDTYYRNFAVYVYTIPLNPAKTVLSVTLPTNHNIALLAADLVS